jgi:endonuclease/exonuclease/phosphatase family metal-dependent hydrolase
MKEKGGGYSIAFYNVENLFDTINDPHSNDEAFLPCGKHKWASERYYRKIENLSKVISELGDKDGPEILGMAEVENSLVLQDLVKSEKLIKLKYHFIHFDCKDRRGIDVAMLYKENFLKLINAKTFSIPASEDKAYRTRDILFVKGICLGDTMNIFVTHWPSRLGGQEQSEKHRLHVAKELKKIIDSICVKASDNIIVMGDFNDEPDNQSLKILTGNNSCSLKNPFSELKAKNMGSTKYKSSWNLLDQILFSQGLFNGKGVEYKEGSESIFSPLWLYYKNDPKNGPFRTFIGQKYYGGYSDHFPVFIQLKE